MTTVSNGGDSDHVLPLSEDDLLYSGHDGGMIYEWNLVNNQNTRILKEHKSDIWCLNHDRETRRLFSGSADSQVKVWSTKTGDCLTTFEGHTEGVQCLSLQDSKLATGSIDCSVRIWDVDKKKCVNILRHPDSVQAVSFLHSSYNRVVTSCLDRVIRIWDNASGKVIQKLDGHKKPARVIQVSGDTIVSGDMNGLIKIWSARTGECIRDISVHTDEISCIRVHPNNPKLFYSCSQDLTVRLLNMETGICSRIYKSFSNLSSGIHVNTQQRRLYGAGFEGILVLDADYGQLVGNLSSRKTWCLS